MSETETKPKISVIVAVYNVEQYVDKCIKSLIGQTLSDIEIILVDDGSTDSSGEICDRYALKDTRIRVIHQHNQGLSAARNAGLDIARGDYIGIIDSDDYVDEDMYELLYDNIIRADADMSMCGFYHCYYGKEPKIAKPWESLMSPKEAIQAVIEPDRWGASPANKLYKRELFDGIRFPVGKTSEDAYVIIDLILKCKRIMVTTEQKYYYFHREGSITTVKSPKNGFYCIDAYQKNYKKIVAVYPELEEVAHWRLCWAYFVALDMLLLSGSSTEYKYQEKQILRYIKKNTWFIFKNKRFFITRKIAVLGLHINKKVYHMFLMAKNKTYMNKNN